MDRARLLLCAFALAALFATPASAALFEDDFEDDSDGDPLDDTIWDVAKSDADVAITVSDEGTDTHWAEISFGANSDNDDWGRARSDGAWDIDDDGPFTWTVDFRLTDANGTSVIVVPFFFDTAPSDGDDWSNTDLSVIVQYGTGTAGIAKGNIVQAALWDNPTDKNTFAPGLSNDYTQELTVTLDATTISASLEGTDDQSSTTTYSRSYNYGSGVSTDTDGRFGIMLDDGQGEGAKVAQFDNVLLTPEPATLAFLALGAILTLARRRRRA